MSKNVLSNILVEGLKNHGITATPTESCRNNGIVQYGLSLRRGDERVCPIIYINRFLEKFRSGELSADDILSQIIVEYEKLPMPNVPDLDAMMSAPDFIDRINLRLVNEIRNRAMIDERDLVNHVVGGTDLVAIFYFTCINDSESCGTIAITRQLMNRYLPEIEDGAELYRRVINRSESSAKMLSISDVLEKMSEKPFPFPLPDENFLWVMTNESMQHGAGVFLSNQARKMILEHFPGGKVTILPSSVHETLIMETTEDENLEMFFDMVHQVNCTEVPDEDYLSDNVYHYDANTGELVIAE